jgi:hypothetical protein
MNYFLDSNQLPRELFQAFSMAPWHAYRQFGISQKSCEAIPNIQILVLTLWRETLTPDILKHSKKSMAKTDRPAELFGAWERDNIGSVYTKSFDSS